MPIFLLASYPKSGNTWMRALLSNYLSENDGPVSINTLTDMGIRGRRDFDERLGLSSAVMREGEILRWLPALHRSLAAEADLTVFSKTHESWRSLPGGAPLFSRSSFGGVVCIVRNPLDIAVSYAHHMNCGIGQSIKVMGGRKEKVAFRSHDVLPDLVSDWSCNVSGWLDQKELPLEVVSYERMHLDPMSVLEGVVAFAGLSPEPARLTRAVKNARFHRLREQEVRHGFHERQPTAPTFFRKGRVGDWRKALSRDQVRMLVERHGELMARLGYLDEAERFLAGG